MLNIALSDSLVDKLTSISDLNDLLVLHDKVSEPSKIKLTTWATLILPTPPKQLHFIQKAGKANASLEWI